MFNQIHHMMMIVLFMMTMEIYCTVRATTTTSPTTTTNQQNTSTATPIVYNYDQGNVGLVYPLLHNTPPSPHVYGELVAQVATYPVTVILNPDNINCANSEYDTAIHVLETAGVTILGYVSAQGSPNVACEIRDRINDFACWNLDGFFIDNLESDPGYITSIKAEIISPLDPCGEFQTIHLCDLSSSFCSWHNGTCTRTFAPGSCRTTTTSTPQTATTSSSPITTTSTSQTTTTSSSTITTTSIPQTTTTSYFPTTTTTTAPQTTTTESITTSDRRRLQRENQPYEKRRRRTNSATEKKIWLNVPKILSDESNMILADVVIHYDGTYENFNGSNSMPDYLLANSMSEYPYSRYRSGLFFHDVALCDVLLAMKDAVNLRAGWIFVTEESSKFEATSLPSYTNIVSHHIEIANDCVIPQRTFGCSCDFDPSDMTCACCKEDGGSTCCSASFQNDLPIQNGRCQICDVDGCLDDRDGQENGSITTTLLIISLIICGVIIFLIMFVYVLCWKCSIKEKIDINRQRTETRRKNTLTLDTKDHGLVIGETVDVVSRRIWHKAEVLHIHSDNKSVTLRRLEDNKIARKIPLSKIRKNGVRLTSRSRTVTRYDDVHIGAGTPKIRKHEPFSLRTRDDL